MSAFSSPSRTGVHRTRLLLLGAGAMTLVLSTYFLAGIEDAIFAFLRADLLIALYLLVKRLLITALLIAAAWWLMAATQGRQTTLHGLGVVGRTHQLHWGWFLVLAGSGIVCSVVGITLGEYLWNLLLALFHLSLGASSDWGLATEQPLTRGESILALCIFAPIGEEVFFRGFLYQALANKFVPIVAILGSACIFAFLHFQPAGFVSYFLVGVAAALLRQYTGSIWSGAVLHSVLNALFVLAVLLH